jgi:hypothetical protein
MIGSGRKLWGNFRTSVVVIPYPKAIGCALRVHNQRKVFRESEDIAGHGKVVTRMS